jgi:hypothetical protein
MPADVEKLKLADAITHLLEECRMVLPGVQALFGFQLIAVFNRGFATRLMPFEQDLHLAALALVAVSVALLMTPAALHRQSSPREASERFLRVGSRFLLAAMPPLLCAIAIDFFLIAHIVLDEAQPAAAITAVLVVVFVACWFVFPRIYRRLYHRG